MILSVAGVSKAYGAEQVLRGITFLVNEDDRVGLVGANGVGKSTLLKIIIGEIEPDAGSISISKGAQVGYLAQALAGAPGKTVDDLIHDSLVDLRRLEQQLRRLEGEMAASAGPRLEALLTEYGATAEQFERRGGYEVDHRIEAVLSGLRLDHISRQREFSTLSGGEKARIGLASLLLRAPDLLLLDEPTNHLDLATLGWLETYLAGYRGALLVVSHERQFLDGTVSSIIEIDEHSREGRHYPGNYEAYVRSKAQERAKWQEEYVAQQEEIKELRRMLRSKARSVGHNRPARDADKTAYKFAGEKVDQAVSRNVRALEERLHRIEADPVPRPPEMIRINPGFDPHDLAGRIPLSASGIEKSFGGRRLLKDVRLEVPPDGRIVLMGANGAGKSTLLRILAGAEAPDAGQVYAAPTVRIGFLDQEQADLDLTQSVLDAYGAGVQASPEQLISDLIRYGLFVYDDVRKPLGALSIGQRRKLQVARLIAERANVLLLDEPTNHLSLDVLEELESALMDFPGPIVAVSHDRRFIRRFALQIWELRDGTLIRFPGGFDDYMDSGLGASEQ